jgi:hypothetical protein
MVLSRVVMGVSLLFVVQAVAAEAPPQPTPKIHNTACSLAESMSSKFAAKKMSAEDAKRTCAQLAPTMGDADHAEFMRCCTKRFQ